MNKRLREDLPKPDAHDYYEAFAESGWYDKDAKSAGWPVVLDTLISRTLEIKPAEDVHLVLDLGAGTGLALAAIRQRSRPDRIVAVDFSTKMLEFLKAKYIADEVTIETDTIQHYVQECPEKFDLITSFSVLEFLPNLPMTLHDTARLLQPGGALAFTYVSRGPEDAPEKLIDGSTTIIGATMFEYHWLPEEIESALTDSGLDVVEHVEAATPELRGLDYSFVVAQQPQA